MSDSFVLARLRTVAFVCTLTGVEFRTRDKGGEVAASPDEILSLVFFARVVEQRSFTAAAAKLGVSKSAVSTRLSQLEALLGVTLLHRTTRKLSLTPEGLALYEHCARIVAAADEAAAQAAGASDTPRGVVRINAPILFAQEYLALPLAEYLKRYRDVRVELTMSDQAIDLVEQGVDLAVRITPRLRDAGLVARRLATDCTVLCASPAYLARKGTPELPEDLLQHDCLVYSLLKLSDQWRFRKSKSKEVYSVPVDGRFAAASGAVLREAARAGMGVCVLPNFMVHGDLESGRLQQVVDSFVATELSVFAVYPEAHRTPSKVRALIDLLVAHFRHPPWKEPH